MKSLVKIFCFFLSINLLAADSGDSFHQINGSLTLKSKEGYFYELGRDSFVRFVNTQDNDGNWFEEVQLVDEDNNVISDETFRVSKKYLYKSVSIPIEKSIELQNSQNKQIVKTIENSKFVILRSSKGKWKYYDIVMIDEDGNRVDHNGNRDGSAVFRVSQSFFDRAHLDAKIAALVDEVTEEENVVVDPCPVFMTSSIRPRARPDNFDEVVAAQKGEEASEFWPESKSPYDLLMEKRKWFLKTYPKRNQCQKALRNYEKELLAKSSWKGTSIKERAKKIEDLAYKAWNAVKKASKDSGKYAKKRSRWTNYINGHYFHPNVGPKLATCVAYQETRGFLNPLMYNYKYCYQTKSPPSTAHSLGQIVRTTMGDMFNLPKSNLFPLDTPAAKKHRGKGYKQVHSAMSKDPLFQMEAVLRTLNEKAKVQVNRSKGKLKGDAHLKATIANYDQDGKSAYVKAVFNCHECLMAGKDSYTCYQGVLSDNK